MLKYATYTADDFAMLPDSTAYELVNGQLLERKMGTESSWVGGKLHRLLGNYCEENNLGWTWPADNGFQCFPDPNTVRKPDGAFIRLGRFPGERPPSAGYTRIAPDLIVEVVSPNELVYEIDEKVADYLAVGVRLIWVVNPKMRTVTVRRCNGTVDVLCEHDELSGEEVVPGFHCRVRELFWPIPSTGSETPS
jgi:Uma2 family endonuclease